MKKMMREVEKQALAAVSRNPTTRASPAPDESNDLFLYPYPEIISGRSSEMVHLTHPAPASLAESQRENRETTRTPHTSHLHCMVQ